MAARAKLWISGLALALAALWSTEDAHAGDKMRVCILKISGTRDENLKSDIIRLINQPYSILKASTFFKTAKRMRIGNRLSPPNLRRIAKFLKLGAMIDGTLVASNGRYKLVLKVRDGRSGVVVERIRHTLRKKNLDDNDKKRLRRDLISALERIRLDAGAGTSGADGFGDDDDDDGGSAAEEPETDDLEGAEADDLEGDAEVDDLEGDVAPRRKTAKERAAERRAARAEKRRKAKEAREARRKAAAEKRRKAREEREARRKAAREKKRAAAEKRRKEREARRAARKAKNSDEEDLETDDLEDDLESDDLEDDLEGGDVEGDDLDDGGDVEDDDVEEGGGTRTAAADVEKDDGEKKDDFEDDPLLTKSGGDKKSGPGGNPAVVANAGLGAFARTLTFDVDSALMGAERPIDYDGGFVPSAFVDLEVYPLALTGGSGVTANIGIDARFEQALRLSSTVDPDGAGGAAALDVDTKYRRYGVGLRYRLALSKLMIGLRVGYGQTKFILDKGSVMGMVDIPNTKYSYLDPGVSLTYSLGKLSVDAAARFLAMLSAGEIQKDTSYGQAKILGLDAGAGINYLVTSSIGVRLGVQLAQVNLKFTGTGALSDRNGDDAQDVDAAKDRYLGGYLTGSYRF